MCASAHCIDHRKHVSIDSEVVDEDLASQSSGHRERCDEARRSSTKVIDVFVLCSPAKHGTELKLRQWTGVDIRRESG